MSVSAVTRSVCGCKTVRKCYHNMLADLQGHGEKTCIEDVEVGSSTMMVYFYALKKYCGHIFNYTASYHTVESRDLYEVDIHSPSSNTAGNEVTPKEKRPVILIDAGQSAGEEPVILSLLLIERLMACEENEQMIQYVRWIILPSVNPDGLEHVRFNRKIWFKNTRKNEEDEASYGVDISRNFDSHWGDCPNNKNGFSYHYPGPVPASEAETKFVQSVILKNKKNIQAYVSIRKGGHCILYPHAFSDKKEQSSLASEIAESISFKVNQRGSMFQTFANESIYRMNGKAQCGSSVDYATNQGIEVAFEMRVGYRQDLDIIQQFQRLPTGFDSSLRSAYIAGFRELYDAID